MIRCLACATVLILSPIGAVDAAEPPAVVRILFVGNSYTSANNLPGMLATLSKAGDRFVPT